MQGTKSNRGPNVGIFKLADEAQMGGLNSLMATSDSKSLSGNNNLGEHDGELGNYTRQISKITNKIRKQNKKTFHRQCHHSIENETETNKPN